MAHELTNEEWNRAWLAQTDELDWVLNELSKNPRLWRKLCLLRVFCKGCGEMLADVMDIRPYQTMRTRSTPQKPWGEEQSAEYAQMAAARDRGELSRQDFAKWLVGWRKLLPRSIRTGGDWVPLPLPDAGTLERQNDRDTGLWRSACSCSRHENLSMRLIYNAMDSGLKSITISPVRRDNTTLD